MYEITVYWKNSDTGETWQNDFSFADKKEADECYRENDEATDGFSFVYNIEKNYDDDFGGGDEGGY